MGRLRHREFSHNFIDPAHQAIAKRQGRVLALSDAFTRERNREKAVNRCQT